MLLRISFFQQHQRCGYNRMTARQRAAVLAMSVRALTRVLVRPNATLRVCHASNRVVMCGADGVRFRSASEPVRASLVFFHASLGSEIDNAITLLHVAPTRPAPMSA